mgnify:CR=1 FL=1|tara:strand:- start:125 stop:313 length:189 start_codon:yes stop_codon:yes gene_type:complete
MNVNKLIGILNKVEDKSLPIRIIELDEDGWFKDNHWLEEVEISDTGSSGYEIEGEVRLYGGV